MFMFFVLYHLMLSGNLYGSEIRRGIFLVLKFGPGIFLGFDFTPIRSSLSLEIRSSPVGSVPLIFSVRLQSVKVYSGC